MTARFLYLKNDGSPTRWDGTRYFEYLETVRESLPEDLRSLTSSARFNLPSASELSLWHSGINFIHIDRDQIKFGAVNRYGSRRFEFTYTGVMKVQTTLVRSYYMPSIVVQELVLMRGGTLRHTFSNLGGDFITIHSSGLTFQEDILQ